MPLGPQIFGKRETNSCVLRWTFDLLRSAEPATVNPLSSRDGVGDERRRQCERSEPDRRLVRADDRAARLASHRLLGEPRSDSTFLAPHAADDAASQPCFARLSNLAWSQDDQTVEPELFAEDEQPRLSFDWRRWVVPVVLVLLAIVAGVIVMALVVFSNGPRINDGPQQGESSPIPTPNPPSSMAFRVELPHHPSTPRSSNSHLVNTHRYQLHHL